MSGYTRLGCGLWDWDPFVGLSAEARCVWLALYTTAEAKRLVPGLWHGGVPSLADAAKMSTSDVLSALDAMVEREVIAVDLRVRVIRLCSLPDDGEKAANGRVLRSWWTKFCTVPECQVRNDHIELLRWLTPKTSDHQAVWDTTFGTVRELPRVSKRRAEPRVPADVQPDLFASADIGNRMRYGLAYPRDPDLDLVLGSDPGSDPSSTSGAEASPGDRFGPASPTGPLAVVRPLVPERPAQRLPPDTAHASASAAPAPSSAPSSPIAASGGRRRLR